MIGRVIYVNVFMLFVSIAVAAQVRSEHRGTIQERAQELEPFIKESAERYRIDPKILRVVCFLESRYQLGAISPKGARGPMQFMPATAIKYGLSDPHDPKGAFDAGARYLRDLLRRFKGRLDLALAAYNAGEGTVEAFMHGRSLRLPSGKLVNPKKIITGGIPPYHATQQYVRSAISLLMRGSDVRLKSFFGDHSKERAIRRVSHRDFSFDVLSINDASARITNSHFIDVP